MRKMAALICLPLLLVATVWGAVPERNLVDRVNRRGASGVIAVRAGGKRFSENVEVSFRRTHATDSKRKIAAGLSAKRRKAKSPDGGRRRMASAPKGEPAVLAMYDISIMANGKKWQPNAGEPVRVDVELDEPVPVTDTASLGVVHLADDGTVEELEASRYGFTFNDAKTAVTAFWFSATGFSVYSIVDGVTGDITGRRLYDFYSLDFDTSSPYYNTYVPRYFTTVEGNKTFRQIIKSGEMLVDPEVLPSPFHRTFIGWFLYDAAKANKTVDGVTYDGDGYATTRFDFDRPIMFDTPGTSENHYTEELVLRARFAHEAYVVFHEQEVDGEWPITGVRRSVLAYNASNGKWEASVKIDDMTVTYDDATDDEEEHENSMPRMIFRGWSRVPVKAGSLTNQQGGEIVREESPFVISLGNLVGEYGDVPAEFTPVDLYPVFVNINWLTYKAADAGQGATYIPPAFYYQDEGVASFPVPERTGYTFDGWWTGTNASAVQVSTAAGALITGANLSGWGGKVENGMLRLTSDVTLYGKWSPAPTRYTVVVWQQKITDAATLPESEKTYDFVESYTNSAMSATSVSVPQAYKSYSFEGFHYDHCDDAKVVNGNGSTVLNVYYDRNVHTLAFFTSSTVSISYGSNSGTLGNRVTSTSTIDTLEGLGSSNKKTISGYEVAKSGTSYYLKIGTSWYQISNRGSNVYDASSISISALARYVTALAGSRVSTVFPIEGYTGKTWVGDTFYTERLASFEVMPNTDIKFTLSSNTGNGGTNHYYVEVDSQDEMGADGVAKDGKYYKLYKSIVHDYNFLTETEDFHDIPGYVKSDSDCKFVSGRYPGSGNITKGTVCKFYYDREPHTIEFKDSYDQGILKSVDVEYSEEIAGHVPTTVTSSRLGYNFTGWYLDEACSTRVFFDAASYNSYTKNKVLYESMPANNLQVFAGWEAEWYLIQIDPNGGQLAEGQSTWFWKTYGYKDIQEYTTTTRSFAESLSGTYFYAVKNRDYYKFSDEWNDIEDFISERGAYYTTDQSDEAIADPHKRYAPAVNAYRYAGWYEVKPDGTEELYAFGQPVTHNLLLRLHWKHIGTYRLLYMAGDGTMSHDDENEVTFKLLEGGAYADNSEVLITRTAVPPAGYSFSGWRIRYGDDTIYHPGQSFIFNSAYAMTGTDANGQTVKQLVLDAVYDKVTTTRLTTDANGGVVDGDVANTLTLAYDNPPALITNVTDTARTVSGMRNNAYGYLSNGAGYSCEFDGEALPFLGWNTKADGTGTHFDAGTLVGLDMFGTPDENGEHVLYAEWAVKVYFDKANENVEDWKDAEWTAKGYTWDPNKGESGMYYKTTTLNGYAEYPDIIFEPVVHNEMFVFWSTNRYTDATLLEPHDFSEPVTRPLTLYARYQNLIEVPFHAVDATEQTIVRKDDTWIDAENKVFRIGNYTNVSFEDAPANITADDGYDYAFTCVSTGKDAISEAKKIKRLYFNSAHDIRAVYVEYADGVTPDGPIPDDMEIYSVYYRNPRPINIGYKVMETSGGLAAVNTTAAAPGSDSLGSNAWDMASTVTTPLDYPSSSSTYKHYAYAIGDPDADNGAQLHFITGSKSTNDDRPKLWVKNTWRGLAYSTDEGENKDWHNYGFDAQLYVVYFNSQPTIINLTEQTIGTEADMATEFEYVVAVSNTIVTITETQTGTREGGRGSKPTIGGNGYTQDEGYWWSSSDITWTWSGSTFSNTRTAAEVSLVNHSLKDREVETVTLFNSVTPVGNWNLGTISTSSYTEWFTTYYRQTRTRTRTSVTNSQTVVITQVPKSGFTTMNDNGDGGYVYTTESAAAATKRSVTYVNTRETIPLELHVAFAQSNTVDHVDTAWRTTAEADYTVTVPISVSPDNTFAVSNAVLMAMTNTLLKTTPAGRRFAGIFYGKPDETNLEDENRVILLGRVDSVGFVNQQNGPYYRLCLNGDTSLELGSYRLYYVYCAMPKIYYVKEGANGSLLTIDPITYANDPVSMNDVVVTQGVTLDVGETDALAIASAGRDRFHVPSVLDGTREASLNRIAFGVGAAGLSDTNVMDCVTLGDEIQLQVFDGILKWSVDGSDWGFFTGEPAVYAIYKEIGRDLTIVETSLASDEDKAADKFTLTITSDNLKNDVAYVVSGYVVDGVPVESVRPSNGAITLTLTNGCNITIQSLPDYDAKYTLVEQLAPGYVLTNVMFNGHEAISQEHVENGTTTFMGRDKTVEFTNIKRYAVTFKDENGGTLQPATDYFYGTKREELTIPTELTKATDATNLYRFKGWEPEVEDVGSNAVYTAAYKAFRIPQVTQRVADTNLTVKLSDEALIATLDAMGIGLFSDEYSEAEVSAMLNARDPNGLRRWENLVTGTPFDRLLLSTSVDVSSDAMSFGLDGVPGKATDLGYKVLHDLRKYSNGAWSRVAGPVTGVNQSLSIGLTGEGENPANVSGYYRVVTMLVPNHELSITNEIPSTNIVGVLEVVSSLKNTMTAVPWNALARDPADPQNITVAGYIAPALLGVGDSICALNDNGVYEKWTLQPKRGETAEWTPAAATISTKGDSMGVMTVTSEPDERGLERGNAVWVTREVTSKPYFLVGQYSGAPVQIAIAGGTTTAKGSTMITNPTLSPAGINDFNWGNSPSAEDVIQIPNGSAAPIALLWRNNAWGYSAKVYDAKKKRYVKEWKTDITVPAGMGFWYYRTGEAFTVSIAVDRID